MSSLFFILLFSLFTGLASLLHESCWHQQLAVLLGSGPRAAAVTQSVFLLGLGIGYQLFGQRCAGYSARILLFLTAAAEVLIGVLGWLFPKILLLSFNSLAGIDNALIVDLIVSCLSILPASILMGATLPLLTESFEENSSDSHQLLYAINALGACIGAVLAPSFFIIEYGLAGTRVIASVVNIAAGLGFALLALSKAPKPRLAVQSEESSAERNFDPLWVAFLCGMISLALQSIAIRVAGLSLGSSAASFSLVVGAHIFCISFGTLLFRSSPLRMSRINLIKLGTAGTILFYILVPFLPHLSLELRSQFPNDAASLPAFQASVFFGAALILLPVLGALAAIPPALFSELHDKGANSAKTVAAVYAANTLGTVTGAALIGHFALEIFELDQLLLLQIPFLGLAWYLSVDRSVRSSVALRVRGTAVSVATVALLLLAFPWDYKHMSIGLFHEDPQDSQVLLNPRGFFEELRPIKLIYHDDGPSASVAVLEFPAEGKRVSSRTVMINGKPDGNTEGDRRTLELVGHIPALLSPSDSADSLVVGFGTGMTLQALAAYENIKSIDCVEISPSVMSAAPYFDQETDSARLNPKVNLIEDDAYRLLRSSEKSFDIIISQPSNPWMAGVERLYTKDFLNLAKSKLNEDGLFVQWIAGYNLGKESLEIIVKTLKTVFPQVRVFQNGWDILFVTSNEALEVDFTRLKSRFAAPEVNKLLKRISVSSPEALLSLESWLPQSAFSSDVPIHSMQWPKLSHLVERDFFERVQFHLDHYSQTPIDRLTKLDAARSSLLSKYILSNGINFKSLVEGACGSLEVSLNEKHWRSERSPCRDALLGSYFFGILPPPEWLAKEIDLMRQVFSQDGKQFEFPAEIDRSIVVRLFSEYQSPLLQLPVSRLREIVSPCLSGERNEDLMCSSFYVQALVQSGQCELASEEQLVLAQRLSKVTGGSQAAKELEDYASLIC